MLFKKEVKSFYISKILYKFKLGFILLDFKAFLRIIKIMAYLYQLSLKIFVSALSLLKKWNFHKSNNLQLKTVIPVKRTVSIKASSALKKIKENCQILIKSNSKAFSLIELLLSISLIVILLSISSVTYIKYSKDTQLQFLKNHGDMIAKSLSDCMFYKKDSKECLLGIPDNGRTYDLQKNNLLTKIELTAFEEPLSALKASWDNSSNGQNFCFQFKRKIREKVYKICVDVNRKTKIIRSMLSNENFCCDEFGGACALPLTLKSSIIEDVSSSNCKNKGFSDDFSSYLSRSGFAQVKCNQGTCLQMSSSTCPIGQSWDGSACVCPSGSHKSGSSCISCPSGQSWNGSACACPSGSHWNGSSCISCPSGQSWNGSACACPAGSHLSGGNCITPSCPPNHVRFHIKVRGIDFKFFRMISPAIFNELKRS